MPNKDEVKTGYLKDLPVADERYEWVELQITEGNTGHLISKGTPEQIAAGEAVVTMVGEDAAVYFVGYPFIGKEDFYNAEGTQVIKSEPRMLNLGLPIKALFFSDLHHSFACVRTDVYNVD